MTLPARQQQQRGLTVILVLVFAGVLGLSVTALIGFIFVQAKLGSAKQVREQAFGVAEAGLEYYHWFLAHNPGDVTNGTGQPGPYERDYYDPEGDKIGSYSLAVEGNTACGVVQSIDVTATGTVDADTRFTRTVTGRHAEPSVAEYAYVFDESVHIGSASEITGPLHGNSGLRMDGTNNSLVTSAVESWSCDESFGCDPPETKPGVFGDGANSNLWQYPAGEISFTTMTASFSDLKSYAQSDGIYLAPYGNTEINYGGYDTAVDGYHLVFNADGTVDIYRVTDTSGYWGYRSGIGWTPDFHIIDQEEFVERRSIPADCAVIFVEDKTWIEGVVKGKVTVVTADLVNDYDPNVIIRDNVDYAGLDGSDGITVLSEFGVYLSPDSPDDLLLRGIYAALNDRFGRPYYENNVRDQYTLHGTIVSKVRSGVAWTCSGVVCSGYVDRDSSYDRLQRTDPPPFTPTTTTTPRYILWQEQ